MRRNSSNWIARIFAIAAAGALPTVAGCDHALDETHKDASVIVDLHEVATDLAGDLTPDDFGPSIRRPFLVGSSLRAAPVEARHDWSDMAPRADGLDLPTRQALAASWSKDALEEHASVAAFARFALMGLSVGAPSDIVLDAQRASIDEIRHARICFGLAARYGAKAVGPGALRVDDALAVLDLEALAALTAQEGCVGETIGALLAERQAAVATDAFVKTALSRVATDERRHAELAWRFVAWATSVGGPRVTAAVATATHDAIRATRASAIRVLSVDVETWHAHGRLTCAESRVVADEAIELIVLPALHALEGRKRSASVG